MGDQCVSVEVAGSGFGCRAGGISAIRCTKDSHLVSVEGNAFNLCSYKNNQNLYFDQCCPVRILKSSFSCWLVGVSDV